MQQNNTSLTIRLIKAIALSLSLLLGAVTSIALANNEKVVKTAKLEDEAVVACLKPSRVETAELEKKLNWHPKPGSYCGGTFKKQQTLTVANGLEIEADAISLAESGWSNLSGNVIIHKDSKLLEAKTARIFRKNGKVERIKLYGDIFYSEPGRIIYGASAELNTQNDSGSLVDVLYRLSVSANEVEETEEQQYITAWGQACWVKRNEQGDLAFGNVTYTTCPPANKTWYLKARELELNKSDNKAVVRKATLYIKNKPYLYIPYISFPLDTRRKSGFLRSGLQYASQNGFSYALPYYMNIAPNFDMTLRPEYFTKRGLMLGGETRYLTPLSYGEFEGQFITKDRAFRQFKSDNLWIAPQLAELSDNRYGLKWKHDTVINKQLDFHIDYERVSDDYFLQDFNNNLVEAGDNQLLQQASASFKTKHWSYRLIFQGYQTLHPFNQSVVNDVYSTLPALNIRGHYNKLPHDFFTDILIQASRFVWNGAQLNGSKPPEGGRYVFVPTVGIDGQYNGYFIKPQITLHSSYYDLSNYNGQNKTISRLIPQASIDTGVLFERNLTQGWLQTLEPRIYYLYVPYVKQSMVPVFDTSYFFSSYNQLFRNNRFAGLDRVGDANKIALGLSSRFIEEETGLERLRFSMGTEYWFEKPQVMFCQQFNDSSCMDMPNQIGYVPPSKGFSSLQFETEAKLNRQFSLFGNVAFNLSNKALNNALASIHYQPKLNHIVNIGYGFLKNGDPIQLTTRVKESINLHQIRLSYAWPFAAHWRSIGAGSYNLSHRFPMSYLLGLQYDDCCVALRLVGGRVYRFYNPNGSPTYGNNVYFQVLFKGLGTAANTDPGNIIHNFLPTYRDEFR